MACWTGSLAVAQAQVYVPLSRADSLTIVQRKQQFRKAALRIAIPSAVFGLAAMANSPRFSTILFEAREEIQEETQEAFSSFDARGLDDYSRHAPLAVAYALMATGHRGERTAVGFTLTYLLARELDATVVSNLKRVTAQARPNGDPNSFPSSHTSQAFLTATLLHEQYGRRYPWLSVSGYAVATATGTMRVLGNKHWASDVLAGAAIGFLSAETMWHLYPALTKALPSQMAQRLLLVPTYVAGGGAGLAVAVQL
ncbi:phosphatase PAP2 family protein [Hymenobacter sp. BT683]|uniref:Phosphatase PAP2 family protein n=1 Tax=Hymenobacter jeongseonensis TaxID=2791027 RepID=A0ABS0INX8_9BACT|nr:phosphatase PAP2 family protein [Hymenobacter jeongseonensis]MBF9239588.1 phosphatase PAP2 family protein [Hymenobacter jeongseonensis]